MYNAKFKQVKVGKMNDVMKGLQYTQVEPTNYSEWTIRTHKSQGIYRDETRCTSKQF